MTEKDPMSPTRTEPRRIRLPGFLVEDETGLGDLLKRATSVAGIRPCDSCQQRARALNRMLVFTGRTRRQP